MTKRRNTTFGFNTPDPNIVYIQISQNIIFVNYHKTIKIQKSNTYMEKSSLKRMTQQQSRSLNRDSILAIKNFGRSDSR